MGITRPIKLFDERTTIYDWPSYCGIEEDELNLFTDEDDDAALVMEANYSEFLLQLRIIQMRVLYWIDDFVSK